MSVQQEPSLANCPRCKAIFVRFEWHVCQKCIHTEEADFSLIRDVLSKKPDLTPDELAISSSVTLACVLRMLDEEELTNQNPDSEVQCIRCSAQALNNGHGLCISCLLDLDRRLREELNVARSNQKPPPRGVAYHVHQLLTAKRRR